MGVSLLTRAGLPELVASSPQEYILTALRLAGDLHGLTKLRALLRPLLAQSTLTAAGRFGRDIAHQYRRLWRHWCG